MTVGCNEADKVRFAAHLLEGPAAAWWETYQITTPMEEVTWEMFQDAFRTAHFSAGVLSLKKREFHKLKAREQDRVRVHRDLQQVVTLCPG